MKRIPLLFLLTISIRPPVLPAQVAQGTMHCISIKLNSSTNEYLYSLEVHSSGTPAGTGELFPVQAPGSGLIRPMTETYTSNLKLYDLFWEAAYNGMLTNTLPLADMDGNQQPDFFETSRSVDLVSTGSWWAVGWDQGALKPLEAQWVRSANSSTGYCVLNLGEFLEFTNDFEILEYTGPVSYTPGSNSISAALTFNRTGQPTNTFTGSLLFSKTTTNQYNELMLHPGALTNEVSEACYFTNHLFYRDVNWPSNYAGYVEFDDDADLGTRHPYAVWVLTITDPNDANGNGIPDFSDDPDLRPQLILGRTSTNLLLSVKGEVGRVHEVLYASPTLTSTWQTVLSTSLTVSPQVIPLAFPAEAGFWRVRAQ